MKENGRYEQKSKNITEGSISVDDDSMGKKELNTYNGRQRSHTDSPVKLKQPVDGEQNFSSDLIHNIETRKSDGHLVESHKSKPHINESSSEEVIDAVSEDTLTLTSTVDLYGNNIVEPNNDVLREPNEKENNSKNFYSEENQPKDPAVEIEAWDARKDFEKTLSIINTNKSLIKDEVKTKIETEKNMDILPNRINSPFFLKQVDISEEMVKTDPNMSADLHLTSLDSPIKKSNIYQKPRGISINSNSTAYDKSESYSRSSSASESSNSSNIRVVVRVRPLCDGEKQRGDKHVVEYPGQGIIWVDTGSNQTKPFTFNTVFNENYPQQKVFEESGIRDLIDKTLDGFSCTIFAFGQTGSGKTYTITGPPEQDAQDMLTDDGMYGLVPRSFKCLFEAVSKRSSSSYLIRASFLEVYNEKVKDLLNPSNSHDSLSVRWSSKKGFYVDNLFTVECETLEDLMSVLIEGSNNRQVGVNAMNDHSSRSHSMLTLYVDSEETESDEELGFPVVKHGKISFVDLAGSERVKETKTTGETLTESNNINKSLLTLGNCISALGDPKKRGNHIPYRESKLTKLLADSLGGDGFTLMIACISPSLHVVQDTMNTLRYANRAKNIKNKPVVKMDPKEQLLHRLKREMKLLKAENGYFRQQLGVPCSEAQITITPNQIEGELTPNEYGTLSPAIGTNTLSSIQSSRNNSSKDLPSQGIPRANTALYALGAKNGLYDMLQEYMNENESLKAENMQLHHSRAMAQREQEELFRENDRLAKKLDDLGRVMLATPLSREHVRTWISGDSPSFDIFSRQTTEDKMSVDNGSAQNKEKHILRFPPVRQGSYPNYINSDQLSSQVEYEKQKLYQKREKEKILQERKANVEVEKTTPVALKIGQKKANVEPNHATTSQNNTPSVKSYMKIKQSYHNENEIKDEFEHGKETNNTVSNEDIKENKLETNPITSNGTGQSGSRQSNMKGRDLTKQRKHTQPRSWRIKKKPGTVEKPSSYAAKFAARKSLLTKQQQTQPLQQSTQSTQPQQIDSSTQQYQETVQQNQQAMYYAEQQAYNQMPMYGYNGYSLGYPYMGLGMIPMQQGMHVNNPNGYNAGNQHQLELDPQNGPIQTEIKQKPKPKHLKQKKGR